MAINGIGRPRTAPAIARARRVSIVDLLKMNGGMSARQVSKQTGIGRDMVKRDLDILRRKGVVQRYMQMTDARVIMYRVVKEL